MSIQSNTTVFSEGGYAAKPKYNREALEKISNEIDTILKSREQQRLVSAAKRQAAQSGRAALSGETDPRFSAGAANKPNNPWSAEKKQPAPAGETDPRFSAGAVNKPNNPWSAEKKQPVPTGETDPRFSAGAAKPASAQVFAPRQQPEKEEEQKPQGGAALRYATKSDMDKNRGSGMAGLFGGETGNPKNTAASDLNRTKGAGIAAVAGKIPQNYFDKIIEWSRSGEPRLSSREQFLYNRNKNMGEIAGGEFYDYLAPFRDPSLVNYKPTPREQQMINRSNQIYNSYVNGEEYLNREEFDSNLEYLMVADFNRFRATPAKVTSDVLNMIADGIDELTGKEKNTFCDWLRSMENNSEILEKSEKQYSQVDYDSEFINELVVGTHKELVDTASQAFMGGILKIPPKSLSSIYAATEIYNAAREKGYSVEEAMGESGAIAIVNESANFALDSLGDSISDERIKSVLEVLADTTTKTASDMWFETNGEEGSLSIEGIANTLAVGAAVELIVKGCKEIAPLIM